MKKAGERGYEVESMRGIVRVGYRFHHHLVLITENSNNNKNY